MVADRFDSEGSSVIRPFLSKRYEVGAILALGISFSQLFINVIERTVGLTRIC